MQQDLKEQSMDSTSLANRTVWKNSDTVYPLKWKQKEVSLGFDHSTPGRERAKFTQGLEDSDSDSDSGTEDSDSDSDSG